MHRLWLAVACVLLCALAGTIVGKAEAHRLPGWWVRSALCVHRYEGAWNDPNPPFYGGLQFLRSTWIANGGLRYASYPHYANVHQQLDVAYVLWRRAGWAPWPNTSRMCGLR